MIENFNHDFFNFVKNAPSSYHCVNEMGRYLQEAGFIELDETSEWQLQKNTCYYVTREKGSIICFTTDNNYPNPPADNAVAFLGAHTDSPGFKLKPSPLFRSASNNMLGVEVYGSPLISTWFDHALSLAGLVNWLDDAGNLHTTLYNRTSPFLYLPSLAIHLDRTGSKEINAQNHLPLLFSQADENAQIDFNSWLKQEIAVHHTSIDEVLSFDLICYDPKPATFCGANNEFINSPRLDNLASCFIGLKAITSKVPHNPRASFFVCSDHEEVGSISSSGADSSFAVDIFKRIYSNHQSRQRIIRNSLFISMDNAHATHPNYAEKSDNQHPVKMNGGVVIKVNSKQRYSTNSVTNAQFKLICKKTGVDYQEFVMRSDKPCGSTIGPAISAHFGIQSVDVGIPTLGMHAIREITGHKDLYTLYQVISKFLSDE